METTTKLLASVAISFHSDNHSLSIKKNWTVCITH